MGRELVIQLAAEGCSVATCDLDADNVAETALRAEKEAPAGTRITTHLCDVSDEAQVLRFRDEVVAQHETDHVNLVFNNAGIGGGGSFVAGKRRVGPHLRRVLGRRLQLQPGVRAAARRQRRRLSRQHEQRERVLGVARPGMPHTAYSAAKFAVKGFSEALLEDFRINAPHVKVAVVMPGHIGTDIVINSRRILGAAEPEDMPQAELDEFRATFARRGMPADGMADDDLRKLIGMFGDMFRDTAPVSAPQQAATIILDGVRDGKWRILVGDDAHLLDERVRADPEAAYGPDGLDTGDGDDSIDLSGRTLLPGLFDCHVHVSFSGIDILQDLQTPFSYRFFLAAQNLATTLRAGITSVRDAAGADAGVKLAVERGLVAGPRMQISIDMISQTGGHGDEYFPCGLDVPILGLAYPGKPRCIVDGADEMRRKVRELIRAGADVLKVATSGGVLSVGSDPRRAHFRPAELDVLVEEATAAGRFVMAHAQATDGIKNAVRAGVRSIEHGIFLDDEAIGMMLDRGTWLVPTLIAPIWVLESVDAGAQISEASIRKAREVVDIHAESISRAIAAGVRVAMGTDAGVGPHGENLRELALMAKAGLTPAAVLAGDDLEAARLLGVDDSAGTIEEGKLADLVVVDGDPYQLDDLGSRIAQVWKGGVAVPEAGRVVGRRVVLRPADLGAFVSLFRAPGMEQWWPATTDQLARSGFGRGRWGSRRRHPRPRGDRPRVPARRHRHRVAPRRQASAGVAACSARRPSRTHRPGTGHPCYKEVGLSTEAPAEGRTVQPSSSTTGVGERDDAAAPSAAGEAGAVHPGRAR